MALKDLQELRSYLSDNWGESVAKKVLQRIISDINKLEVYPLMGINLVKNIDAPTDYRYLFGTKD